jgi:hypothetical protein
MNDDTLYQEVRDYLSPLIWCCPRALLFNREMYCAETVKTLSSNEQSEQLKMHAIYIKRNPYDYTPFYIARIWRLLKRYIIESFQISEMIDLMSISLFMITAQRGCLLNFSTKGHRLILFFTMYSFAVGISTIGFQQINNITALLGQNSMSSDISFLAMT